MIRIISHSMSFKCWGVNLTFAMALFVLSCLYYTALFFNHMLLFSEYYCRHSQSNILGGIKTSNVSEAMNCSSTMIRCSITVMVLRFQSIIQTYDMIVIYLLTGAVHHLGSPGQDAIEKVRHSTSRTTTDSTSAWYPHYKQSAWIARTWGRPIAMSRWGWSSEGYPSFRSGRRRIDRHNWGDRRRSDRNTEELFFGTTQTCCNRSLQTVVSVASVEKVRN